MVLGLAVLSVSWVGLQVYRALTARPGTAINYARLANELVMASQPAGMRPDSPNALDILRPAIDACIQVSAEFQARDSTPVILDYASLYAPAEHSPQRYTADVREQMRTDAVEAIGMLRDLGAFEAMAAASAEPYAMRPTPDASPLLEVLLPDLGRTRQLARANAARMFLATRAGDGGEFARAYEDSLAMGRIWTYQTVFIEHLVGFAITALANGELIRDCMEREWDEATLKQCLAALDRQRAWMGGLEIAVEGERLMALDTIQWSHTDDGRGSGRLIPGAIVPFASLTGNSAGMGGWLGTLFEYRIGNLAGIAFASKEASTRKAQEHYDRMLGYVRASPEARAQMEPPEAAVEALSRRYLVLKVLLPGTSKVVEAATAHEVGLAGTRLVLAIEIYHRRTGEFPGSLSDLVPDVLPEVPPDPAAGVPFAYRRLAAGDDPDGRGYLLYSVGLDGVDNGRQVSMTEPRRALTRSGAGLDYVINAPRQKATEPGVEPPS